MWNHAVTDRGAQKRAVFSKLWCFMSKGFFATGDPLQFLLTAKH